MMKFTVICFFLTLEIVVIFGRETIHSPDNVCEYSQTARKKVVKCLRVDNMKVVQDFLSKNLNFTPVSFLDIEKCFTKSLPNSIFCNTTIREIRSQCPFDKMENDALSSIEALKHLDLRKTEFSKIPIAISKLTKLKVLHLTDGKLIRIGTEFQNMTDLWELKMSSNRIFEISREAFSGVSNLKMIDLTENKLYFLHPGTFGGCRELTKIFLQKNLLSSVDGLFNIPSLKEIYLQENNLKSIDDAFQQDINVEILNLNSNPLGLKDRQISDFNAHVKELRILTLSRCQISFLQPTVFRSLTKLEKLVLSRNRLESLPVEIFHGLSSLREIYLMKNRISLLGNVFRHNNRLESIILSENNLQSVGEIFHGLVYLKNVDLKNNKLEFITETDFLTTPSMLYLQLSKNSIYRIDSNAFRSMAGLKNLSLDSNNLMTLNRSLHYSHELETLKLHNNELKEIGRSEMYNLKKLNRLSLSSNKLTNVHEAFRNLIRLKFLNLNNNKLKTISRSTFPPSLPEKLFTGDNPWSCDCRLEWLIKWLIKNTKLASQFKCGSPKEFFKKKAKQLTTQDFTKWRDNCDNSSCECICVLQENEFFVRVDCSGRSLTQVPATLPEEVGELHLQNNLLRNPINLHIHSLPRLRYLDMERNSLTNIDFYLPKNLQTLKLARNNLTRFVSYFPPSILSWTLSDNPWICDSETVQFWKFLTSERKKIWDVNSIRCSGKEGKPNLHGKIICDLTEEELRPEKLKLYIFLAVGLSVLTLMAIGCHIVYTRYRYHLKVWLYSRGISCLKKRDNRDAGKKHDAYLCFSVKDMDFVQEYILPGVALLSGISCLKKRDNRDAGKKHDAYLCFSVKDMDFVQEYILPELEDKEPFYSLFVPPRDLRECRFELDQQLEEVRNSKRILIIVSQNFIDNEVCMEIFRVAFLSGLEEKHYRIIPIVIGTLPPLEELDPSLKVALQLTKSLKFGQKLLWEMVRFSMPDKSHMTEAFGSDDDIDMPLLNAW